MEEALKEHREALEGLRNAVHEMHLNSIQTRDAMGKVINDSYLKSTLTLIQQDIGLRRVLELNPYRPTI